MIFIALVIPTLVGILILAILFREDRTIGLLDRLCLAYPLGAVMITIQMFILGLLRISLTLGNTVLPLVVEIALLLCWIAIKKIPIFPRPHFQFWNDLTSSEMKTIRKVVLVLSLLWIVAKVVSVFVETGLIPIYAWDAWANWSAGAKLFYFTKSLLLDASTQDFFTRGAVSRITNYPIHNPLMQVWMSLWIGRFDEVLIKFWVPLYLVSMVVYLYNLTNRELGRLSAAVLTVIFLSSPLMSYHAVEVYSDLPLGVYLFLALAAFLHAMRGKQSYVPLIGVFSAAAVFTKDEGLFFAFPLIVSAAIFFWQRRANMSDGRRTIASLLIPLLLIAPWYSFKLLHGLGLGVGSTHLEFTFHPEILGAAARALLNLESFNVIIIFLPILLVIAGKPNREFLHLISPVIFYANFFFMLYIFTTYYYNYFMNSVVFYRNILTYYPSLILLIVLLIKRIYLDIYIERIPRQA
jgi:hypothetical protein